MEQIPEHDLLLASVRCTPYSVAGSSALRYGGKAKVFEERNKTEKDIALLGKVLEKHRPCGSLHYAACGGRERDEKMYSEFMFSEADRLYEPVKAVTQWHVIEDKQYYVIPEWCKELFGDDKPDPDKIYSVVYEKRGNGTRKTLRKLDNCPTLTQGRWYRTFVFDGYGFRRITPKEYMVVQGDRETKFPVDMSHGKIWETLGHAGIYGIEEKIAFRIRQVLEGNSLQENIAEYLLGEFDDKKFLYRKKAGMVCMPTGTGYTKTVKYLVQGIIKRTEGKWKIIVLKTYRMLCSQMEQILQDSGYTVQTSVSLEDTNNFLTDSREILVVTYTGWENYIRRFKPKGVHVNLVLLGAHAERGWRYLIGTEKYLPQAIYAGVASSPDLEAAEEREGQIDAFRNSHRSVLITVVMWRDMQISDVSQIYVLKRAGRNELWEILSLASAKYPGKQSVRVVIREREVLEEAHPVEDAGSAFKNAAEKGAVLENALLRLLRRLFIWNREDNPDLEEKMKVVLCSLQKRPGGDQNGKASPLSVATEKNYVCASERLGGLEVLHLAPVGQEAGEQFALHGTEDEEQLERWEQFSGNRKFRALMEKPFFLDMIRILLESGENIGEMQFPSMNIT